MATCETCDDFDDDSTDCANCGGEGFTYGCSWDWQCDPAKGFDRKLDVNGEIIAWHHDETWLADFEEASARVQRQLALEELERREEARP